MQHEHDVEHARFLGRVLHVVTQHVEEGLCSRKARLGRINVHGAAWDGALTARQIGQGGDARQAAQELNGNLDLVALVDGVDLVCAIGGVEHEHAARHHVHDVPGRVVHDEVVDEPVRQITIAVDGSIEALELGALGQIARYQKIREFLITRAALGGGSIDKVLDVIATQGQTSLIGHAHALVREIAMHVGYRRDASHDTRAIGIAQTALDVEVAIVALVITAIGTEVLKDLGFL